MACCGWLRLSRPGYTAFETVLAEADAISLHCPLTAETKGLIGSAELRAMKRSALLINTARGGIVDEAALIQALKEGWIAGAGFDVVTIEPPPVDHPMLALELLALPNFLLTPHVAWASRPAISDMGASNGRLPTGGVTRQNAAELLALPNFLLTPHVAWASRPAMQALAGQLIDNIESFVAGTPQNRVV